MATADVIPEYATDEEIAIETPDFWTLAPPDQLDAYGTDGALAAAAPWVLTSALVDFARIGVRPRTMVFLSDPEGGPVVFGTEPGEAFAVDHVVPDDPHSLTLRRKGKPLLIGDPPGNGRDDLAGVRFTIRTLQAQVQNASQEIDEEYGVADYLARYPGAEFTAADRRMLSTLTICKVLERGYMAISRGTEVPGAKEIYMQKSENYRLRGQRVGEKLVLRLTTPAGREVEFRPRGYRRIF